MSNCAIVGINWGDEGKGRMVDLIARDYDIVCRYQGGTISRAVFPIITTPQFRIFPSGVISFILIFIAIEHHKNRQL